MALLEHLVDQGGAFEIRHALLLFPDGQIVHTLTQDEIALIANVKAMLTLSSSLMGSQDTSFAHVGTKDATCLFFKVKDCSLVIVCTNPPDKAAKQALQAYIIEATDVLKKLLNLKSTLSG